MAEPPITVRAVHDSGPGNLPPTRYVVHCTAGGRGYPRESAAGVARGTAVYFTKATAGGSAHYIHDAGGAEEHCVPEDTVAWHAPPNPSSIGDEICADPTYTREQWLSPEVWPAVRASARRCREVCDRHGIPKVKLSAADLRADKSGICGHVDVSDAFGQSSHWDPGPNFPWDAYMAEVNRDPAATDTSEEDDMPQLISTSVAPGQEAVVNIAPSGALGKPAGAAGWGQAWLSVVVDTFDKPRADVKVRLAIMDGSGAFRPMFGKDMVTTLKPGKRHVVTARPGDCALVVTAYDHPVGVCVEYARA